MSSIMSVSDKVLVVGGGRMGSAIIEGWLQQGTPPDSIYLIDNNLDTLKAYEQKGLHTFESVDHVPLDLEFRVFLLALKPQIIMQHISQFNRLISHSTCLVSVAAGVMVQTLLSMLPNAKHVVRVMPNTPAMIGKGVMVGFSESRSEFSGLIEGLFSSLGKFYWVSKEEEMHAVTAISGSGPAYLFYFAQCFIESAQSLGLDADFAKALALDTLTGASHLIEESGIDVETLRQNVTSPNGTTQAGLEALMRNEELKERVTACCVAARQRSEELA
ncbi:pyrroline-5-carboxylate reductase [Marinomonas alcarazii]|uniref:Pyrroline-5-carboxylate reductase n=1 Tax=Marinomonas alcarazii TaxID=491949 RepID=A0A318V3W2_9GAMM|nr:pyrroline-5-carboxylate reductase [Marinomonas alcarazii]PYF82460.1 pyrroline-5-carboxylate reductase [Marinomonas alcarazii]